MRRREYIRRLLWDIARAQLSHIYWAIEILRLLRIKYVPSKQFVACVNPSCELILSDIWVELAEKSRDLGYMDMAPGFVLLHEILHILLNHPNIMERFCKKHGERYRVDALKKAYNFASDAIVNDIIGEATQIEYIDVVNTRRILEEMGVHGLIMWRDSIKLAEELLQYIHVLEIPFPGADLLSREDSDDATDREEIIEEGSEDIYSSGDPIDALRKHMNSIGVLPGSIKRLIEPKEAPIDWLYLLNATLMYGRRYTVFVDWKKPSRRAPNMPSHRKKYNPRIWCLVDVSGSIDDKTLNMFFGEILNIAKSGYFSEVIAVPWDTKPKGIIKIRTLEDIDGIKIRGRGGTVIASTLKFLLRRIRSGDVVLILTDGRIYDISKKKTKVMLWRLARCVDRIVCVTTSRKIRHPAIFRNIKVNSK